MEVLRVGVDQGGQRETSTVTTVNPGKEGTCAARTERRGRGDGPYAVADSREKEKRKEPLAVLTICTLVRPRPGQHWSAS